MLVHIISYLTAHEKCKLRVVSGRLRSVSETPLLWRELLQLAANKSMVPVYVRAFYRPPNSDVEPIVQPRKFLNSLFNENLVSPM